jgi:hypothetical protein
VWGAAFEDLLATDLPDGRNLADEYLRRRGWKEPAATREYIAGLRHAAISLYEVSGLVPGESMPLRDLVRGGEPIHRGRHREAERKVSRMRTWLGRLARDISRKIAGAAEAVRAAFATPLERIAQAHVPLSFDPGDAYQFDWSHEFVLINGVTVAVRVAHVRLCHSRMMFVRAYPRETQEMVFDAHDRAFAFFRGACTRGIYDSEPQHATGSSAEANKTAVDTIFVGKERAYTNRVRSSSPPTWPSANGRRCSATPR